MKTSNVNMPRDGLGQKKIKTEAILMLLAKSEG